MYTAVTDEVFPCRGFYLHPFVTVGPKQLFNSSIVIQSLAGGAVWQSEMLTNNSHVMLTMCQYYDILNERFTTVFLIMLTTFLTINQMKTNCFLTAVDKFVNFNYPVLLNDYGYPQVC